MTSEPEVVGGRYELGNALGRGGMAEVRRAVDTRLGRSVAVKQLRSDLAGDPTFQARFRREAQSAAGLNHPTIVAVYDTGEETDAITGVSVPYIVMELVDGPTLRDVLRDGRKILPERALELTQGVLDALSYSHKAGIVHRDIKPANVMLTPTGGVKVMDFGIARAVADTSATMTQTAAVIGTAQYLSPEQARGETVDARSDIYSAGCLLYELLVGRPPFIGDSPVSVAYQHVRERPVPPSELDSLITPEIDAITLKALAKDPADRYQNAREMKADITRLLAGQQVTAALPAVFEDDPEPTRVRTAVVPAPTAPDEKPLPTHPDDIEEPKRRTGLVVLIVALVLLVLGGGAYGIYQFTRPQTPVVRQVTVPSVLGYNQAQAESTLRNAQLVPAAKSVTGPAGSTVDTVTKQTPLGSTQAAEGSTVTIEVNQGPKMTTVPDGLVGKDKDAVKKLLEDDGFTVSLSAASSEPTDAKKDDVLTVDPEEGASVAEGTTVTVNYATGESSVPNFIGSSRQGAETVAEQYGFKVSFTEKETTDGAAGTVVEQDPEPNTKAARSTEIKLTIAKAPASTPPQTSAPPQSSAPPSESSGPPSPSSSAS
jgi:serine/threonine-protein kinase